MRLPHLAAVLVTLSLTVPPFLQAPGRDRPRTVLLALARSPGFFAAPARAPAGTFRWPLDGTPVVVRGFEPPPTPYAAGHRGADLAGVPGERVRSAGPGLVTFAADVAGRPTVTVTHPGGLRTTYQPVTATVRAGAAVVAGTPIGELAAGHAGCPVAACLHWGLRSGETYLDPLALLRRARVRLLPSSGEQLR